METSKTALKKFAKTLEEGEIYLLGGKEQVYLAELTTKSSKIQAEVFPVMKNGKIDINKSKVVDIKSTIDFIPLDSKQTTFVSITRAALKKAEKVFKKAIEDDSKSERKTVKSSKPKSTKGDKVYVILRKEKKVVAAKVVGERKKGKRCSFTFNKKKVTRTIPGDFVFGTKTAAQKSLKLSNGKSSSKVPKSAKPQKGYLVLKKSSSILDCTILEDKGDSYKVGITVNGKTYKKVVPRLLVYKTKSAAEAGL